MKSGSVPSLPGNTKSNRDHNSFRLFWIGDPDRMMRWGVRNWKKEFCSHTGMIFYSESTDDELQQLLSKLAKSNMSYFVITPATVIPHASEQDLLSFTMPLFPTINEDMNQLLPWKPTCTVLVLYHEGLWLLVINRFKHQPPTSSELVGIPGLMMRLSFHTSSGWFHPHKWLPPIKKKEKKAQFVHQEQTNQSYSECQPTDMFATICTKLQKKPTSLGSTADANKVIFLKRKFCQSGKIPRSALNIMSSQTFYITQTQLTPSNLLFPHSATANLSNLIRTQRNEWWRHGWPACSRGWSWRQGCEFCAPRPEWCSASCRPAAPPAGSPGCWRRSPGRHSTWRCSAPAGPAGQTGGAVHITGHAEIQLHLFQVTLTCYDSVLFI